MKMEATTSMHKTSKMIKSKINYRCSNHGYMTAELLGVGYYKIK